LKNDKLNSDKILDLSISQKIQIFDQQKQKSKRIHQSKLNFPTFLGIVTFTISNTKLQAQNPENLSNQQLKD